jgi:tetratricopeptide (TPR) repeat protein
MRTTASFELFPDAPSERAMVRARWLAREGRLSEAESAYRDALTTYPDLKPAWAEYFELLRSQKRSADALRLAFGARTQFGEAAFALALEGAALIELDRFREALEVLEHAVEADPDLAVVWHELGYAAYRLGDRNRALLALDRAFALEPHGATLRLRGKVLRDAGRYQAAEVAFEAAAQSAEHDEQWDEASDEVAATRRYALYAPRKPADLGPAERWFAETGSVLLSSGPAAAAPTDAELVSALGELASDSRWRFGQIVRFSENSAGLWAPLTERLDAPLVSAGGLDPAAVPLMVAAQPLTGDPAWDAGVAAIASRNAGCVFVLEQAGAGPARADIIGTLTDGGVRRPGTPNVVHALTEAQHPAARLASRRLSLT